MGTSTRERVTSYRKLLRKRGYRQVTLYLPAQTLERLQTVAQQTGLAFGDLIALSLAC